MTVETEGTINQSISQGELTGYPIKSFVDETLDPLGMLEKEGVKKVKFNPPRIFQCPKLLAMARFENCLLTFQDILKNFIIMRPS